MKNIVQLRRSFTIKIINTIKDLENGIKHNTNSTNNLRVSDLNISYIENRIEKIKVDSNEKQNAIITYNEKILLIENGECDTEIETELQTNATVKQKDKVIKFTEKDIQKSKEVYKNEQNEKRQNKHYDKNTGSSYRYLLKTSDKMPVFMKNNLNDMPNNKGYIWKDIWYFGAKKAEQPVNVLILFEKKYDQRDVLFIHEYSPNEYKLFKKQGKNRKELIESRIRRKII